MFCFSGFHSTVIHSSGNTLLKSLLLPVPHAIMKNTSVSLLFTSKKALVFS